MKRALALDMDDLIYPFMSAIVSFHNSNYGTALSSDDFHTFDFDQVWGGTPDEAFAKVDECFERLGDREIDLLPMNGADVAIHALAEHFRLFVVTARADELQERTVKWLTHHFAGVFEDVILCNSYVTDGRASVRTKGEVVEQLDAVGLVDDSARHIAEVAAQGRLAVLYGDYAWNRNAELPESVHRARTWPEVLNIILPEGTP